jgi:hypothetical protein
MRVLSVVVTKEEYSRLTAAAVIARSVFGYPDDGRGASVSSLTSLMCLKEDANVCKRTLP